MLSMLSGEYPRKHGAQGAPESRTPAPAAHFSSTIGTQPPKGFWMRTINRTKVQSSESRARRPKAMTPGLVWLLTLVSPLSTPLHAHAGPERAVVRLPSHGG